MNMTKKSRHEFSLMKKAGLIVYDTLQRLRDAVKPGVSTLDLDKIAEETIRSKGAIPTFKGYHGFPASICASINDVVVHGIPYASSILNEGDIISIDCGATYRGLVGDSAITVAVGEVSDDVKTLLEETNAALFDAVTMMKPNNYLEDVSGIIEQRALKNNFGLVRDYGGHGIGRAMHEAPFVHNYKTGDRGPKLFVGMALAIEPMFNLGCDEVYTLEDGWTVSTKDGKYSAHFEHTILITEDGPVIATLPGN